MITVKLHFLEDLSSSCGSAVDFIEDIIAALKDTRTAISGSYTGRASEMADTAIETLVTHYDTLKDCCTALQSHIDLTCQDFTEADGYYRKAGAPSDRRNTRAD